MLGPPGPSKERAVPECYSEQNVAAPPASILLQGYYGFGNFGDDLLLKSIEAIVRGLWPRAAIDLFVNFTGDVSGSDGTPHYREYVRSFLSGPVDLVDWTSHGHYDLILHGGGGVFFSVGDDGLTYRVGSSVVRTVGAPMWAALASSLRRLLSRPERITAERRVAIGVGLGPFGRGDRRFLADAETLGRLHRIAVRDEVSLSEARRLGLGDRTKAFTDIAFALDLPRAPARDATPRIGLVICQGKRFSDLMVNFVRRSDVYEVVPILFDENADRKAIAQLEAEGIQPLVWRPREMDIEQFCRHLGQFELIVTNRAHGAIAAALIGVPTLILDTDPKLRSIHAMLTQGSFLIRPGSVDELWFNIDRALENSNILRAGLERDVAAQRVQIPKMIDYALSQQ